jgi:beta-N-acetylhexosaminidase
VKKPLLRPAVSIAVAAVVGLGLCACGGPKVRSGKKTTPSAPRSTTTSSSTSTSSTTTSSTAPAGVCTTPAQWSATRAADQLLMVLGAFTSAETLAPEARAGAGGFVFLGEPPASAGPAIRSSLAGLGADAAGAGQVEPWMSTDTEGGPVSRLANVLGAIPSARQMAAQWTPSQVESAMESRGAAMRNLGITMDLAPVLDTASLTDQVAYESQRSFSATPQVVTAYGTALAAGLRAAGVEAVGKHFPGLGHASADTDTGPSEDPSLSQLRADDLVPFIRVIASGLPVVMVGHPIVPGLTGGLPASLSPATYTLLRTTLHFGGVTMTDALGAGAVSAAGFSEPSAAVAALRAGVDMPMINASTWQATVQAIVSALSDGSLARSRVDASVTRILVAKGEPAC